MHFHPIANNYDATFTNTPIGRLQRSQVWKALERYTVAAPMRILELNCGTGVDAVHFAAKGHQVLATDAAPGMIDITAARAKVMHLDHLISTRVSPFDTITQLPETGFDLVFSNFGGVNCIPTSELGQLAEDCREKLRPGGVLAMVVMGRFCYWETLYFLAKGKWSTAFRRLRREASTANLSSQHVVPTWYHSKGSLKNLPGYQHLGSVPIGLAIPPSYLNPFFAKRERLLNGLAKIEQFFFRQQVTFGADHFLILLQKTST